MEYEDRNYVEVKVGLYTIFCHPIAVIREMERGNFGERASSNLILRFGDGTKIVTVEKFRC
ncbi:MAG: hypothetical protein WDM76_09575 [Limisphaerales bacterium]